MLNPITGVDPRIEAKELAAQVWSQPEQRARVMDIDFSLSIAATFEPLVRERNHWIETAQREARNVEYWRRRCLLVESLAREPGG